MPPIDFTPDAEPIAFTPDGGKGTVDFQPDTPAGASISRPAPDDSLADQFKGVGQAFQRGVTSGLRAVDVLGELTDRRVPTTRQGRAAFERAMQDPRYMAQLSEASRLEIEDPAAGKKRAAQAEDVFGPAAKLEQIRRPIVTEQEARRFDIANASEQLANAPRTQAMQRWEKADNSNWWQVFAADPVEITASIIAESFPQSAIGSAVGGALGAQLGAPGMAAGVGAGSFATEYANSLLASAGEAGFDLTKPEAVKAFFASPQAQADAKAKAMARGVPIAVMDAATAGLAGKFLGPTLGKGVRQVAMGTAKEIGMQMAGGMAGELGAQVASGEPIDFKEIAAEGIGELGGAPAEAVGNIKAERARQAVPKTGTAQPPVTPDVTAPAPEQPKVEVTRDLAKELQAALTGNQGKATPVTPAVTPPAPAPPAEPLRFRAIVEEGKVPSELVIQPLTEELYDAVIHVPGLTPDFDQFKAENPDATHLKRQLLPTGKFASGHKFGPLNELVPPGIGSKWEDITNAKPEGRREKPEDSAPAAPLSTRLSPLSSQTLSTPPPAAAVPPPAAPAPPAPAAAVSPAPAANPVPISSSVTPQALPSSPAGDSLAAPLTPPAPGPSAPAQSVAKQRRRNPAVEEIWKKYSETGEIETARDLADALDGVEKLPAPLTKAVRMFRKAIQDDVKEFGQRSGLEDQFASQLESVVEKYVAGTPAPPAAVEQERKPAAVDVSTIEQATTEQEMYKATGALLTAAKTEAEMAKIRAAQRKWIEQREAAALTPPAPEPGAADAPFSRREAAAPEYTVGSGVPYAGRIYRVLSVKGDQVQIQDSAVGGEKRWVSKAQLKLAQEMARKPREETPADELPITIGNQFDRGDGFYITKAGLDIGEGPFDTKEQAAEWAEAEVFGRVKIVEVANNKSSDIGNSRRSDRDAEYLAAVERGDLATAQRMVDEAAKAAGYDTNDGNGFWHTGTFKNTPETRIASDENTQSQGLYLARERSDSDGVYNGETRKFYVEFGNRWNGDIADYYESILNDALDIFNGKNDLEFSSWKEAKEHYGQDFQREIEKVFGDPTTPDGASYSRAIFNNIEKWDINPALKTLDLENDGYTSQDDGWQVIIFDPAQIKSADPVTYDDAGRVIPLSERFNPESNDIRNSRAEAAAEPAVSVASAQARADELTAKWVLPFGVEVVQTWRDLPARAQRGITEQDGHTVEGRYVPGSGVFLVADNLASPDRVAAVVLHEVLGHFGIDTVLGEQRDAFMLDVFEKLKGKPLFQFKVRQYAADFANGEYPTTERDRILMGRELVAAIAEDPKEYMGLWQRIVDAVRRWLREIGWVQDVTEADIREALRRADRELRGEMSNVQRPTSNVEPALAARRNKVITGEERARNFANWFRNSKVVNADGTPRAVYHGSKRPDRIGAKFLKKRATSGPMAFFTDDPEIASNYATSKRDTSLEHPDDYSGWFKFKPPGSRTSVPIDRAWWFLSAEQRAKLADTLPRVSSTDENGDSLPDGQYRLTAPGETGLMSKDSWDYELRQARGNSLKAAVEAWLNSGSLFNREDEFLDVLRTAGLNGVEFDSPWAEYSGVFPVHLSIQNPLNTAAIPENVIAELNAVGKRKRARGQYGTDQWDKNTVSGPDWLERLNNDQKDGTAHAWTSIPDWVTDTLIKLGYDGIQDTGGKKGGRQHGVWIPFFESQVKSATGNRGTYDPESNDMTFSRTSQPEPRESDDLPKRVGTRNASGENATEDALRDQTVINVAAMRKDPKLVAKVEALIRAEYPQLRLAEGQDPIEALTQFVENNLIWLHNQMDPEVRARAKLWYDGARKIVLQWEQQYGRPREAVAAVIAKLSPQRDWFQNLELAERVIAITNQLTGDEKLTDEMDQEILSWIYKKPTAKQVETPEKKARFYANQAAFEKAHFAMRHVAYRDMNPWQKAVFVRAHSSTALPNRYNIWTPEGERLGFKYKKPETKTKKPKPLEEAKLGWPGFDTIAGAISILENPTLQNISDTLGNEHKIRNFYNNIILPNSEYGDVTIDTHAVAAGQLKALAGDDMEVGHNFGTGAPSSDVIGVSGLYAIYADAYRRAAAQLGLQPRQLQSITWEEIRALFTEEFKAQEANKQLVENVWQRYAAGNLTLEEARNEIKALATDSQPDWVGVQSGAPATATPWTLPDRGQLSGARRYFEPRPRQRRSEEFAAALDQAAARRAAGLSPFSRTSQPTEPLPDLLARRDDAAARGITYAAQREKLRSEGKTIPESLKKAEREQAEIFKEAQFQLLRHPDYVAQQVRAVDAKLDELNTLNERQRILKQQGTDLESDARARLADLEQWLPIETGEIPYGNADEFVGIPPSLVKQAIERTSGLKHFVTEAEKERVRAILDNPDLSPEQKDRLLADLERNRGRALAEVPLPNALPPRANVALATSTTLAGNQDARTWWESFARWARNLASATPEIPLFGPLARLNVPMRGFLNAIRAGNMTAARDAEAMVQDVVQPLLALPRTQLDPNALARHQAIARKLQAAERQFDQQAERMRAEIAAMEQMRADRAAITERREALAEFEGNPPAKIAELQKQLAEAVNNLGTNPMWLFKQAVLFRDYVSRFQMLAPKQQGRFKFPGNLSIQDVVNELERTNAAIEASPARAAIKEAMDRHYRAMAELEAELLKRGHIIPEAMKNGAYFPHQVLDYTSQHLGRLKPATEAPFRGYLVDPTGSRKAIETDYIQAVYRHAAEVMAHNSHQDAVEKFLKPWDKSDSIRETVAAKAAAEGRTAGRFEWRSEDNLPPGFVFYDAAKKLPLRLGYVMDPQTIADALGIALKDGDVIDQMRKLGVDFVVEPEMLQQALVAGEKQPWVIPKEMAEALDGILERQRQEDAIARAPVTRRLRQAVALWKLNTLFAPWHYIRYEWGNTMSDLVDKLGGADPGMAKYLPQAFKEVIAFADKKEATPEIRAAFEQRVLDTITFAEVEKVKDSPAFEQLRSDTQRALSMAGTAAKNITFPPLPIIRLLSGANVRSTVELSRLREATFRYAKFLADLNRIRNGERPVYAGAYWKDAEAEKTPEEKAAFIARRTFGDYGDLSVAGEYLRRNLVPFWSWTEINFRYHVNLLRNMADMIRKGEFGDAAQSARAIAAWTALRLALPYAAVHLWNTVGGAMAGAWDDDDDLEATLSDADRRRFHLILGKDERGQTKVIYMPTAFSDVVSWFGGDNAARLLAEYARGDITFERVVGDFAKQIGPDTLNKVAQSTGPIGKGVFIAVSGKQPFPDITNMRSVGGREKWFAVVQTMTDREGTDLLRRAFDNDYYPRPAGEVAQQLILQIRRRDPEQWAFYEVKEKVSQWKEQKTGKRFEAGDYQAPEAQALRGFRRAVYLGDVDAAERFYNRLLGFGYTSERLKASIRNQHPLAELNEEGRKEFIKSLSRADREQLRRALQYWERLSTLKGKERGLFPAKPGQRFTPQPERLRNAVESFDRRTDEDVERTARRLMDAALTGRR